MSHFFAARKTHAITRLVSAKRRNRAATIVSRLYRTRAITTALSSTLISRNVAHSRESASACVTFDKIDLQQDDRQAFHNRSAEYRRSSAVITGGRSARSCFAANQTSNRPIRDIFKGFRPAFCQRIRDNREIWRVQTHHEVTSAREYSELLITPRNDNACKVSFVEVFAAVSAPSRCEDCEFWLNWSPGDLKSLFQLCKHVLLCFNVIVYITLRSHDHMPGMKLGGHSETKTDINIKSKLGNQSWDKRLDE